MPEGQLHVRGRPVSDTWIVRWACEEVAALLCWRSPLAGRGTRRSPTRRRLWLRPKAGGRGDHRRPAVVDRVDDLARIYPLEVDSAPRGAMRKEMRDENISSVPAGMPVLG